MFVKVITGPGPEIYGGLCPEALVLPDSFGVALVVGFAGLVALAPYLFLLFLFILSDAS